MRITYLCPSISTPTGGIKVIYRHAEILASLDFDSAVLHPDDRTFRCRWFRNNTRFRDADVFSPKDDFIIIPEVWAGRFGPRIVELGIDFAVLVQGGYLMLDDVANSAAVYREANFVCAISEDTRELISLSIPGIDQKKIIRLKPSISEKFIRKKEKTRTIAFMPRRLESHATHIGNLLKPYLPAGWNLLPIHDRTEDEVAEILSKTSIFLSFSYQEGLAFPPMEAAASGNIVVGYTGEGGKEYFRHPVFRAIPHGDYRAFVSAALSAIKDIENNAIFNAEYAHQIEELKLNYSEDVERNLLSNFTNEIAKLRNMHDV